MEKLGKFILGFLLSLMLVAILALLVLKGWSMYEMEKNRIAHQNDKVAAPVVASVAEKHCLFIEAAPCCLAQKTMPHPKQPHQPTSAKVAPVSKKMSTIIVAEKPLSTIIVAGKPSATSIVGTKTDPRWGRQSGPGLLEGVDK